MGSPNGGIIGVINPSSFGKDTVTSTSSGDLTTQPGTRVVETLQLLQVVVEHMVEEELELELVDLDVYQVFPVVVEQYFLSNYSWRRWSNSLLLVMILLLLEIHQQEAVDDLTSIPGGSGSGGFASSGIGAIGNVGGYSPPEGNDGGNALIAAPFYGGGGGGGAGAQAGSPSSPSGAGAGGNGAVSTITGSPVTYAGGGGGSVTGCTGGALGGSGGGGAGAKSPVTPGSEIGVAGTVNTGGGGGGGGFPGGVGGVRRFRNRYRKRIKQGQWIVATESTI
jgi:hypothetical protein